MKCSECGNPSVTSIKKGNGPCAPVCRGCCEKLLKEDMKKDRYGHAD